MLRFGILGPVELYEAERRVPIGGARQMALLTFLLLHANQGVSADGLIDALWGEQSSAGALKRVQVAIARLRKVLDSDRPDLNGAPRLRTVAGGYVLSVAPGELDADVFEALVEDGRRAVDADEAER